jgi:hydrogenase maturation factor
MTAACSCITCGDVAVVVRVLELRGANALVTRGAESEEVAVELVAPVEVGDELLCHAGVALARVAT